MNSISCDICGSPSKNKKALATHKSTYHRKADYIPQIRSSQAEPISVRIYPKTDAERVNEALDEYKDNFEEKKWKQLKREAQDAIDENNGKRKKTNQGEEQEDQEDNSPTIPRPKNKMKRPTDIQDDKPAEEKSCRFCNERFANDRELAIHVETQHPTCVICRKQFSSREAFDDHEHPQCRICNSTFSTEEALNDHLRIHPKCQQCGETFLDENQRRIHWNSRHRRPSPDSVDSDDSEISWDRPKRPRYREFSPEEPEDQESDATTVSAVNDLVPYEKPQSDGESTPSDLAVVPYEEQVSDTSSIDSFPSSQLRKCPICFRKFGYLDDHIRDEHPIKCPICHRRFSTKDELERHTFDQHFKKNKNAKRLSGKRKIKKTLLFVCNVCGKHLPSQKLLDEHAAIHDDGEIAGPSNWEPASNVYECKVCKAILKTKEGYVKHMKDHAMDCTVCAAQFETIGQRDIHISLEHPLCRICGIRFSTNDEFLKHNARIHPENRRYDGELPSDSDDESDRSDYKSTDRQFHKHVNCVNIDKFLQIQDLINQNQFETLANDQELLEALQVIFRGVLKGYIPICSAQRMILTRPMKKLMFDFGNNSSTTLLLRNKKNLKQLFKILWQSVQLVIDSYMKYNTAD